MRSKRRQKSNFRISAMKEHQLIRVMNHNHALAKKTMGSFLRYAKLAGDALRAAKKKYGKDGQWMDWVKANFNGKYTTATIYMRVSRDWNRPDVREARENGALDSIATFLSLTKKAQWIEAVGPDEAIAQAKVDELRNDIVSVWKINTKKLRGKLLQVFFENADDLWDAAEKKGRELMAFEAAEAEARDEEVAEAEAAERKLDRRSYKRSRLSPNAFDDPNWDAGMFPKSKRSSAA